MVAEQKGFEYIPSGFIGSNKNDSKIIFNFNVNRGMGKKCFIYMAHGNEGAGDNTMVEFGFIRCGYSNNNVTKTKLGGSDLVSLSANESGLLIITTTGHNVSCSIFG